MNEEHLKIESNEEQQGVEITYVNEEKKEDTIVNEAFIERTKAFKEGTGEVEFVDLKLLDEEGRETYSFAFDQLMRLKIKLRLNADVSFGVAYHIRDDKNMELLGSSTLRELRELIQGKKGDQYEITVSTRLPLIEGNYNITLVASTPVIENRTALFLDYIENASVFMVEENQQSKLWDKVYLKNEITVRKIV